MASEFDERRSSLGNKSKIPDIDIRSINDFGSKADSSEFTPASQSEPNITVSGKLLQGKDSKDPSK